MYLHLIVSALFPIYTGAHASLRRPPSASKSPKLGKDEDHEDEDGEYDVDVESTVEVLTPSDAIMFPILAGLTLTVLYFLFKWMQDPELLNKILNYYFSLMGILGVGKLAADSLNVATTFVFPHVWSSGGNVFLIDALQSQQVKQMDNHIGSKIHHQFTEKANPFPGSVSAIHFPRVVNQLFWNVRGLLKEQWIFCGYIHGFLNVKSKVQVNDVIGAVIGIISIIAYNLTGKAWWLMNLIGFGFSYGTLQLLSPTTFWTGSLVLTGLFVYDIVMVFYTPMMISVATNLDGPIKLIVPGPGRGSMLGLGDVVLPGIMMALALRFDLYLKYGRIQQATRSQDNTICRPRYEEVTGKWGERFWTWGSARVTMADAARFPKVYFTASIIGYVAGMTVTLIVLNIFQHGQPALLYLVPAVLGSLWGTALIRGELNLMWSYTEDGSIDIEPTAGEIASNTAAESVTAEKQATATQKSADNCDAHGRQVLLFSLTASRRSKTVLS